MAGFIRNTMKVPLLILLCLLDLIFMFHLPLLTPKLHKCTLLLLLCLCLLILLLLLAPFPFYTDRQMSASQCVLPSHNLIFSISCQFFPPFLMSLSAWLNHLFLGHTIVPFPLNFNSSVLAAFLFHMATPEIIFLLTQLNKFWIQTSVKISVLIFPFLFLSWYFSKSS